jgi:tRNA(Ile)-lysidine synthetase-like protein
LIKTVLNTINENNMFTSGDKVIVAVSGGPDSLCLLHILYKLKERLNISLYVAHVNHCLRGNESDEDEKFVKEFCKKINVEFRSIKVDINKVASKYNLSCETAGRKIRYEFFEELKSQFGAQKIAVAHNANDQAETVLMRIMRGTGLDGLTGIKPVRDDIFVRPLINTTRNEIEKYCEENGLKPRIDKTNYETIYSRNKIRLELIPYMEKNFNKDVIRSLNRLAQTIRVDNDYCNIVITRNNKTNVEHVNSYVLHEGYNNIPEYHCKVKIKSYNCKQCIKSKDKFTQYFDMDKINGDIVLRTRCEGDRFVPLGMKGSKKLKDLFIDLKISKNERNNIPLICFGKNIAWVVGYRISDIFKVDKSTKNILAISFESEEI